MNPRIGKIRSFSLVELMVVIAVIAILAGLVLGGAGAVRQRAARSQAKSEIGAIEAGLTRYQMEVGTYPTAIQNLSGNSYVAAPSTAAGQVLFTNLWGAATFSAGTGRRQYLNVKPSMVNTSGVNYFIDPWGNAYGYYWNGANALFGGAVPDVWSIGGPPGQTNRARWITSWE